MHPVAAKKPSASSSRLSARQSYLVVFREDSHVAGADINLLAFLEREIPRHACRASSASRFLKEQYLRFHGQGAGESGSQTATSGGIA